MAQVLTQDEVDGLLNAVNEDFDPEEQLVSFDILNEVLSRLTYPVQPKEEERTAEFLLTEFEKMIPQKKPKLDLSIKKQFSKKDAKEIYDRCVYGWLDWKTLTLEVKLKIMSGK